MKDGSLSPPLPLSFALGAQMGETSVRDHDHPLILGEANVDSAPLDALGKKMIFICFPRIWLEAAAQNKRSRCKNAVLCSTETTLSG